MSWFYGEPINDRPFSHYAEGFEFFSSRCDFDGGVYVVVPDINESPDPKRLMKATAECIGYHACVIHKELNGFRGYGGIHYEFIGREEADKLKKEFGLNVHQEQFMQDHMNIPKQLHVGFQNRNDTYTGKLGYVIYTDEKGKRRKEGSWEGWRSKSIDPLDVENVPTSGFVLNRKAGGVGSGWGWNDRVEKVRVYDPRDFEFEISIPNLLFILSECNAIKGKGLEGEFVYAWAGTELILLPVTSQEYITSVEFTKAKSMKVTKADMIEGHVYKNKDLQDMIYLGRLDHRKEIERASIVNGPDMKSHIFYNTATEDWVFERGFTRLSYKVGDEPHPEFADKYTAFMESKYVSPFKQFKIIDVPEDEDNYHRRWGFFIIELDGVNRIFREDNIYDPRHQEQRNSYYYRNDYYRITDADREFKIELDLNKLDDPEYALTFDKMVFNDEHRYSHRDRRLGIWEDDERLKGATIKTLVYELESGTTEKVSGYVSQR